MQRTDLALLPLIAVLAATAAWSLGTESRVALEQPGEEALCLATLEPATVLAQDDEILLAVAFAREPGAVPELRSEAGSGLRVLSLDRSRRDVDGEWYARVDVSKARVGTWRLEFVGERAVCVADLEVTEPDSGRSE